MIPLPSSCSPCPLYNAKKGFVPPTGPTDAKLLFVAEAAGSTESYRGEPLVGDAGWIFNRLLSMNDLDRDDQRIGNIVSCQPPGNKLRNTPWEFAAIDACGQYRDPLLAENHSVIVAMGAIAIRTILDIPYATTQDFHGTVHEKDGKLVVCTYHPSFLQRGGRALLYTVRDDIARAKRISREGFERSPAELIIDPSPSDFMIWVLMVLDLVEKGEEVWLSVDIETPEKVAKLDEGRLTTRDVSYRITRINFAYRDDQGLTVPFDPRYEKGIRLLLENPEIVKCLWNHKFDVPILEKCGFPILGRIIDFMDAWHFLQSDIPRGLGFVAPFFSDYGAWKHLSGEKPAEYGAVDGLQTQRNAYGIASKLMEEGRWERFLRHFSRVDEVALRPAERVGVLIDVEGLPKFSEELHTKGAALKLEAQQHFPEELKLLHPRKGWTKDPGPSKEVPKLSSDPLPVIKIATRRIVQVCKTCNTYPVAKSHKCAHLKGNKTVQPLIVTEERPVDRWFVREPFNPGSPQQVLSVIQHWKHKPGKNLQTGNPSADKVTLERLATAARPSPKHSSTFYQNILDYREIEKVRGTYVDATLERLRQARAQGDFSNRIHPTFGNKPSTFRNSCVNPNLQNVVADRKGKESLAAGFKRYIIAAPDAWLIEGDFAAIEAVLTGYFAHDPEYIRLARLGVHAYLASYLLKNPADLSWPDAKLRDFFAELKAKHPDVYNQAKRCVHGTNYGLTPFGMRQRFPSTFSSISIAKHTQDTYLALCVKLAAWQWKVQDLAARQHYLGGPGYHPYDYKHWFHEIQEYKRITDQKAQWMLAEKGRGKKVNPVVQFHRQWFEVRPGEDAKRAVAFMPQSTAAGVLREAELYLFDPEIAGEHYIGEMGLDGETPLRAPIHDSLLLESKQKDAVVQHLHAVMTRGWEDLPLDPSWEMGEYLSFGCEIKVGRNWRDMEVVHVDAAADTGVGEEWYDPDEEAEDEYPSYYASA